MGGTRDHGVGLVFVGTLLALAIAFPHPTPFQGHVFRVVLALAAGALGALIPGFIEVTFEGWLRAGGALALFAIVYGINPPALIAKGEPPAETSSPEAPSRSV